MSIHPLRIAHVGLVARDLEGLAAFYQDVLGLVESDRMPYPEDSAFTEGVWLRCNADHHVISIFGLRDEGAAAAERTAGTWPPPPAALARPGVHHFAFELESFEALRDAARLARERGVPIQGTRVGGPGCHVRIYIWDPEGNLIELYWGLDQIGWDGRARPYPPITLVDLERFDVDAWLADKTGYEPPQPS